MSAADPGYQTERVMRLLGETADRVAALERRAVTWAERATVTNVGGTMCDVEFDNGATAVVPYATNYSPSEGDRVTVLHHSGGSVVLHEVSA